jgi:hyperosmotically inducible protein
MKTFDFISGGMALLVLLSSSAIAQSAVDPSSSNTTGGMTKKDIRVQNRATSKAVRKALYSVKGLQSDQIVVVARGHIVTLEGTVPEESQIALAEAAVKNVPQVQKTVNRITIRESGGH